MAELLKYTVSHYRKEGVTPEEFEKFFMEIHVPTALGLFQKYGIVKYAVQRRNVELGASFEPMLKSIHPTWEVSKADLVIEYWMPNLDCLMKVVTDPEWEGKAVKGQEEWIDISRGTTHICHETVYLEDSKTMNL